MVTSRQFLRLVAVILNPRLFRRREGPGSGPLLALLLLLAALPVTAQDGYQELRREMVENQLRGRGIQQAGLLDAMNTVPRHLFVPEGSEGSAYDDVPLPAPGEDGGILQPYISALMIELLQLDENDRVLEIGTGSGYDAAVLSRLAKHVYTVEISPRLAKEAQTRLKDLGYRNISVRAGDGRKGWPEEAPFDAIVLTAAPEDIPTELIDQLRMNGRMVLAVGGFTQNLTLIQKTPRGLEKKRVEPVRLGPLSPSPGPDPE